MKGFMVTRSLLAVVLVFACIGNAMADEISQKSAALWRVVQTEFSLIVVPAARNFISNKITVASLKAGGESLSTEAITKVLQQSSPVKLAIASESDAVAAATLERAFLGLKGKIQVAHEVAFIGDKEYEETLVNKAADIGIKLIFVPYP